MTLTDQLRQILKQAGVPLSLNQIMELLPVGIDRNTVGALLSQRKRVGEFTHCVEDGKAAYGYDGASPKADIEIIATGSGRVTVVEIPPELAKQGSRDPVAPAYIKPGPHTFGELADPLNVESFLGSSALRAKAVLASKAGLLEDVSGSAARVADALYEAIQASASKTLLAKLAVAHKALHEAHVELLGATGGGI